MKVDYRVDDDGKGTSVRPAHGERRCEIRSLGFVMVCAEGDRIVVTVLRVEVSMNLVVNLVHSRQFSS